jgi:hydroxymethylbilane synthase
VLPAPGQGALAVECRRGDLELVSEIGLLDDAASRCAVTAERALLAALEAGCTAPVGALATVSADGLSLQGVAAATDGSVVLRRRLTGPLDDPAALGRELAALLLADGAGRLVDRSGAPVTANGSTPSALRTPSRPFQPSPERAP